MRLYFQCGHGLKKLSETLTQAMPGSTYILSPRDLSEKGQISFAKQLNRVGEGALFDPQLYVPHSDKKNFQTYSYWPKEFVTKEVPWRDLTAKVAELNGKLKTQSFVLPGLPCERIGTSFLRTQEQIIEAADEYHMEKLATVCLKQNVLLDTVQVERLLSAIEVWPVDGVYLIAEHPDDDYFVDSPIWMLNLMKLCSGLRIQNKKVILGYANHQMLLLACTGIHAIASGNWMNTRSFTLSKFEESDEVKRHKVWYYAPQAFTEFSPAYLDVAKSSGKLPILAPAKGLRTPASILFNANVSPTSVNYTNEMSFFHYLYCLNLQVKDAVAAKTFLGRLKKCRTMMNEAKKILEFLHKHRVNGQNRDFMDIFAVNATALDLFEDQAGPLLSRMDYLFE